jgi:hypothetical protein
MRNYLPLSAVREVLVVLVNKKIIYIIKKIINIIKNERKTLHMEKWLSIFGKG